MIPHHNHLVNVVVITKTRYMVLQLHKVPFKLSNASQIVAIDQEDGGGCVIVVVVAAAAPLEELVANLFDTLVEATRSSLLGQ